MTISSVLLVQRVVYEMAPREVLEKRLAERLADKAYRLSHRTEQKWPACISDEWLQEEIQTLEQALTTKPAWRQHLAERLEKEVAPTRPEPIPENVYWAPLADNFYDVNDRGKGVEFYYKWKPRCSEFPQGEAFGFGPGSAHNPFKDLPVRRVPCANCTSEIYCEMNGCSLPQS